MPPPNLWNWYFLLQESARNQWRSQYRSKGGRVPPFTAKKLSKIGKNLEKIRKRGKSWEKIEKKRKNREEKAKIGKVLSLCPSWQIGLATLLLETLFCTLPPQRWYLGHVPPSVPLPCVMPQEAIQCIPHLNFQGKTDPYEEQTH